MAYKDLINSLILTENYHDALYYLKDRLNNKFYDVNEQSIMNLVSDGKIFEAYHKLLSLINNKETQNKVYRNWLESMTEEEEYVWSKALKFDSKNDDDNPLGAFDDMRLFDYQKEIFYVKQSDRALTENEINMVYNDINCLNSIDINYEDAHLNMEIHDSLSIKGWRFLVIENAESPGCAFYKEKKVIIDKEYVKNDIVLLHEMIHIYNHLLICERLDDYVLIRLYEKLQPLFKNLYDIIDLDNHILNNEHSLLFLLKSLDLDFRAGFDFGTIYGYDREVLFNDLKLNDSTENEVTKELIKEYQTSNKNLKDH